MEKGAELGFLVQLSRPQLKHVADNLAAEQPPRWMSTCPLVEISDATRSKFDVVIKYFPLAEERDGHLKGTVHPKMKISLSTHPHGNFSWVS